MKSFILSAVLVTALTGMLCPVFAQNYYVVVGAFSAEDEATELRAYLPGRSIDTMYAVTQKESVLHLYVFQTQNKEQAVSRSLSLQKAIESQNADRASLNEDYRPNSLAPAIEKRTSGFVDQPLSSAPPIVEEPMTVSSGTRKQGGSAIRPLVKPRGKYFRFTIATMDGSSLPGMIHHIDPVQGRDLAAYAANSYTDIISPGRKPMALVCGIFGYKQVEKLIDYTDPSHTAGAYLDEQGAWVIPYELERVEKGDVSVMYNTAFYKDAVVMLPQSKKELDALVSMMNANPNYEITIHGHCNGKNKRKIIALGDNKNYFDINGSVEKTGSAKHLSFLRADAVRSYLLDQGIAAARIKVYAWGGSYMLVDDESPASKLNDRIEIEIRRD